MVDHLGHLIIWDDWLRNLSRFPTLVRIITIFSHKTRLKAQNNNSFIIFTEQTEESTVFMYLGLLINTYYIAYYTYMSDNFQTQGLVFL